MTSSEELDLFSSPITEEEAGETTESRPSEPSETLFPPGFASWASCRQQAWLQLEGNPNAFFYRHVLPGETQRNGPWSEAETALFLKTLAEHPPESGHWGLFARHIPGRVGYQCNAYYKKLRAAGMIPGVDPLPPHPESSAEKPEKRKPAAPSIPKAPALHAERDFADRYPLREVLTPQFVPGDHVLTDTFGARLRNFMKDASNQALFAGVLDQFTFC
jgi:hypothetical protein